jgi:hypothetical protein
MQIVRGSLKEGDTEYGNKFKGDIISYLEDRVEMQ